MHLVRAALVACFTASLAAAAGAWAGEATPIRPAWLADLYRITPKAGLTADGPRRAAAIEVRVVIGRDGVPVSTYVCCETGPLAARAAALVQTWRYRADRETWGFSEMVAVSPQAGVPDLPFPASASRISIRLQSDASGLILMGGPPGAGGSAEIDQDGKVTYVPGLYYEPPRPGVLTLSGPFDNFPRTGRVSKAEVEALVQKFRDADFYRFDGLYHQPVDHAPTVNLTLVMDGRAMTVADHGGFSPLRLRELQDAVVALARKGSDMDVPGAAAATRGPVTSTQPSLVEIIRD